MQTSCSQKLTHILTLLLCGMQGVSFHVSLLGDHSYILRLGFTAHIIIWVYLVFTWVHIGFCSLFTQISHLVSVSFCWRRSQFTLSCHFL